MSKGMRCKYYAIKKVKDGYQVTLPDSDWTRKGVLQIPSSAIHAPFGYEIMDVVQKHTTSYYADCIAKAILRAEGLIA